MCLDCDFEIAMKGEREMEICFAMLRNRGKYVHTYVFGCACGRC